MNTRDAADALHGSTKHGTPPAQPERLVEYRRLDPRNAPRPFKQYRDLPFSRLPRKLVPSTLSAVRVLSGEQAAPSPIDGSLLATLLYLTAGVTRTTTRSGRQRSFFRTAMSAGNLHPIEVYVIAGTGIDGIPAGVYHFAPLEFGLTELRNGDFCSVLSAKANVVFVFSGLVWRTTWKYGERGWRHLYWDAGAMIANLLAAADAHGLDAHVRAGFADDTVARLVGIDGVAEMPLAVVPLGPQTEAESHPAPTPQPLLLDVVPLAPDPIRLPLVAKAQAGSTLTAEEVTDWRQAAHCVGSEAPTRVDIPLWAPEEPIEAVILRRGSTRVMRREPVPHAQLRWPMLASAKAVPFDAAPHGSLLEHYLNVHAVSDLRSGPYRWNRGAMELIVSDDPPRETGSLLCLNQRLGGDSAYTVFHSADLDAILDAMGSRGYRAAQLEAGIVSGRLTLSAFALGLGATGLTFFDDLVSRYFHTTSATMLVTSVGVADTSPAPAGRPGEPITLTRYDDLMARAF